MIVFISVFLAYWTLVIATNIFYIQPYFVKIVCFWNLNIFMWYFIVNDFTLTWIMNRATLYKKVKLLKLIQINFNSIVNKITILYVLYWKRNNMWLDIYYWISLYSLYIFFLQILKLCSNFWDKFTDIVNFNKILT